MNFILNNFWKILFLAALGVGGIRYYKKHQDEQAWANSVVSYSRLTEKLRVTEPASAALPAWEADFWRLLLKTDDTVDKILAKKLMPPEILNRTEGPVDPEGHLRQYIQAAGEKTGYAVNPNAKGEVPRRAGGDPVVLLTEILVENYKLMAEYGIWENAEARAALLNGQAPTIPVGPYKGEKLQLTRRISPFLFRKGITDICNIILLPDSAAATYFPEVDDTIKNFAERLFQCQLIDKNSYEAVKRLHDESSGKNTR